MEHIQIKKPIKIAIICLAALIAAGAVAGASYYSGFKKGEAQTPACSTCPATIKESGVAVKCAYKANSADAYGSYEITYTVTPAIYTDDIVAKIAYSDGAEVPAAVATLDHDIVNQKVTVHCKGVFNKQVDAVIYAASDPTVKATIVFDFTEKLTVTLPESIAISDGAVPAITPTVTTTGGTKTVDKEVRNQTYAWNTSFISWVKAQTQAQIDSEEAADAFQCAYSDEKIGDLVGLSGADAKSFFATAFSANTFLTTKGCGYSYKWEFTDGTDSDDPWTLAEGTWHLGSASHADFLAEFNGTNPVFDWSCTINGKAYSKSFGLTLSAIAVTGITADTTGYSF
jgi:hypothetical protein